MAEEEDVSKLYLTHCKEICQLFVDKGVKDYFNMEVNIGKNFSFKVKHFSTEKSTSDVQPTKKKYVSPSTRRRNNLRLLAFKARRTAKGGCSSKQPVDPPPP